MSEQMNNSFKRHVACDELVLMGMLAWLNVQVKVSRVNAGNGHKCDMCGAPAEAIVDLPGS